MNNLRKLAVLSPINSNDGIAEYSRSLYQKLEDEFERISFLANKDVGQLTYSDNSNVLRVWEYGQTDLSSIVDWLQTNTPDILHIQHHPAHLPIKGLVSIVKDLPNTKAFITLHAVEAVIKELGDRIHELSGFAKILVHNQSSVELLNSVGVRNVELFVHPYWEFEHRDKTNLRSRLGIETKHPIVATHGLMSDHKGLLEVAESVAMLKKTYPEILWLAINAVNPDNVTSSATLANLKERIRGLNISDQTRIFTEFLSEEEVVMLIQAANVGILPYSEVGESASGAARKFISVGTPLIVTDILWMQEFTKEVHKIPNKSPEGIVRTVKFLLENPNKLAKFREAELETADKYSWTNMSKKLMKIYGA